MRSTSTSAVRGSYYTCRHWGELDWVDGMDAGAIGGRWYDNDVDKQDANLFARANWQAAHGLRLFADIQYRYVRYEAWGTNDNYIGQEGMPMQPIDVDKTYHFFNPRAGVSYRLGERNSVFFSFAVAQKEPTRDDFTDRYMFTADYTYPSSEKLYDWELGYTYTAPRLSLGVNLYYMKYKDQLVPMGRINDGYDALNDNVDDSYRRGVELSASWKRPPDGSPHRPTPPSRRTASRTTPESARTVYDNDEDWNVISDGPVALGTTKLAYSPETIANLILDFHYGGFEAAFHTQYVGEQYFANNENDALSLDAYCVTNLNLSYSFRTRNARRIPIWACRSTTFSTPNSREQRLRITAPGSAIRPRSIRPSTSPRRRSTCWPT